MAARHPHGEEGPPHPRWQRRPEARPDEILSAALQVFGDTGFAGSKLEDVARAAGVSKGTLYLYFDSKETLFREMVRVMIADAVESAIQKIDLTEGTATDTLYRILKDAWDLVRRPTMSKMTRLLHSEIITSFPDLARFYFETVIAPVRNVIAQVIERGVRSGEFRPVAHHFARRGVMSLLVHSALYQCTFSSHDPDALTDEQVFEGVVSLTLDGMLLPQGKAFPKVQV